MQVHIVDNYISGDTNCWTYVHQWMLKYLDNRYLNIIGHQGLVRLVYNFPHLKRAIEQNVQSNHQHSPRPQLYAVERVWGH